MLRRLQQQSDDLGQYPDGGVGVNREGISVEGQVWSCNDRDVVRPELLFRDDRLPRAKLNMARDDARAGKNRPVHGATHTKGVLSCDRRPGLFWQLQGYSQTKGPLATETSRCSLGAPLGWVLPRERNS